MSNTEQQPTTYRESLENLKRAIDDNTNKMLIALDNNEPLEPFDIKITVDNKQFNLMLTADLYQDLMSLVKYQIDETE